MAKKETGEKIERINIKEIDPPKDIVRVEIDLEAIAELAESILTRGQLQPIQVRKGAGRYQIIFGHRRYLACKKLNLTHIKAIVKEVTDSDVLVDRAVENIQRVDLTPLEEANTYEVLVSKMGVDFDKIAKLTGKSAGAVKRALNILKMPEYIQRALHKRAISRAVAEELDACPDDNHKQYLAEMAVEHGVTKMIVRNWVNDFKKSLRDKGAAGEGGVPLGFTQEPDPVYVTCFLCRNAVDVLKTESITLCRQCKGELGQILAQKD